VAASSVAIVLVGTALAQQGPLNSPSQIIQQYQQVQNNWLSAVFPAAQRLFFLLAVLEVTWTLTLVVLERADFHSLASTLPTVRKTADELILIDNTTEGRGLRVVARFAKGEIVKLARSIPEWAQKPFGKEFTKWLAQEQRVRERAR